MRTIYTIAVAGVLLFLVWFLARSTNRMNNESRFQPRQDGRSLSVRELKSNEKVVIVVQPSWREAGADRLYQIEGGKPLRIGVKSLDLSRPTEASPTSTLFGKLSDEEAIGLDAYLLFLRRGYQGGSHGREEVVVGYYRNGSKIGEERFRTSRWILSDIRRENGRIIHPERETMGEFPVEVFREIVPPALVEQRLKEPNQALEPTPTSVTSAAEQPPRRL